MMLLVIFQRFLQAFSQLDLRRPTQSLFDLAEVSVVIADVDHFSIFGKGDHFVAATAVYLNEQGGNIQLHKPTCP